MLAIVRKELLVLIGNRQSRMMLVMPPLMQIVLFAWAATMEVRNVEFAVYTQDGGRWSRELTQRVQGSPRFRPPLRLERPEEVQQALDSQRVLLVLAFAADFSAALERGEGARLQILLDGRKSNSAQIANGYVQQIVQGFNAERAAASSPALPEVALRYWFNPTMEFQWFFLPNLIGMLSFALGIIVTALTVAREREMGTFDQLLVSPATPSEIALAKLLPGCLIGQAHGTVFVLLSHFCFGVPVSGSLFLLYGSMFIFSMAVCGLGLMISSMCATQQQAFLGAFACVVPCTLLSGFVTPTDNMPVLLQHLSQVNPLRHFLLIIQGVFLRDLSLAAAAAHCLKLGVTALVSVSIAVWFFRRRRG
ncbi:MAG: ABC transporter permease [Deltaproteobacteria bacterium]|jgi:ABC-2 type transport system permease protein|nr:ABC transporter permease [Deltaproteobacteria bacterium]